MENTNLTPEQIAKVRTAKSVEELIKIAEEEGKKLDEKDAALLFTKLNQPGKELTDDELETVAGGACGKKESPYPWRDFEWYCEHQQDALWEPMWQGTCCICVYSGEDDDSREKVRCHYPNKVRTR